MLLSYMITIFCQNQKFSLPPGRNNFSFFARIDDLDFLGKILPTNWIVKFKTFFFVSGLCIVTQLSEILSFFKSSLDTICFNVNISAFIFLLKAALKNLNFYSPRSFCFFDSEWKGKFGLTILINFTSEISHFDFFTYSTQNS